MSRSLLQEICLFLFSYFASSRGLCSDVKLRSHVSHVQPADVLLNKLLGYPSQGRRKYSLRRVGLRSKIGIWRSHFFYDSLPLHHLNFYGHSLWNRLFERHSEFLFGDLNYAFVSVPMEREEVSLRPTDVHVETLAKLIFSRLIHFPKHIYGPYLETPR